MVDFSRAIEAGTLNFYSDASAAKELGFGAIFNNKWLYAKWELGYISKFEPSIDYLELFALVCAILSWEDKKELQHSRVVVFSDNSATVAMINSMSSSCRNCMYLLRLLTLNNLIHNRRVFAKHVWGILNDLPDALSRLQFKRFWHLAPKSMDKEPSEISAMVWPASHIWQTS